MDKDLKSAIVYENCGCYDRALDAAIKVLKIVRLRAIMPYGQEKLLNPWENSSLNNVLWIKL